jgi:hypothetical protein
MKVSWYISSQFPVVYRGLGKFTESATFEPSEKNQFPCENWRWAYIADSGDYFFFSSFGGGGVDL